MERELLLGHLQGFTKFYCYLLLLLENEFVVLHVFFRVGLQV